MPDDRPNRVRCDRAKKRVFAAHISADKVRRLKRLLVDHDMTVTDWMSRAIDLYLDEFEERAISASSGVEELSMRSSSHGANPDRVP
jgi:hypothetical protein